MSIPARLEIDGTGRVRGDVSISYNDPWPCANGYPSGFESPARGVVLHTEQGYENGTIAWFNNEASQASAWFAVGLNGAIWQFAPVGSGWCSWAQVDGNRTFYSIEDADNANPSAPFSPQQIQSIALLVEVLSRRDGFPLAAATNPFTERGVTLHSEGGSAFGGHLECPGSVRGAQRPQIIELATAIRAGAEPPKGPFRQAAKAGQTLAEIAAARNTTPAHLLGVTAAAYTAEDIAGLAAKPLPEGLPYYTSNP